MSQHVELVRLRNATRMPVDSDRLLSLIEISLDPFCWYFRCGQ